MVPKKLAPIRKESGNAKSRRRRAITRAELGSNPEFRAEIKRLLEHLHAVERFDFKKFRRKFGASQEAIARASELPYQTILRWERGTSRARVDSLIQFCRTLLK